MRILIVEDHASLRIALKMLLELEGYVADAVDSGEAALKLVQEASQSYDLILLDLNTNGIGADQFMEELRVYCREKSLGVPRVGVLSGSTYIAQESARLGADFYIPKPFELDDILSKINLEMSKALAGDVSETWAKPAPADPAEARL